MSEIVIGMNVVIKKYSERGFNITDIHADPEFDSDVLRNALVGKNLHIYTQGEHVGIIERSIRTIKERARCICHALPYKSITRLMTKSVVRNCVKWLNAFPSENGISSTLSPCNLVEGKNKPDLGLKTISFGSYAMVFTKTSNTMSHRSVPGVALEQCNDHGGYYFMNLFTGKKISSNNWNELPIDDDAIVRVEELAYRELQPVMKDGYPIFKWKTGEFIVNDEIENMSDENIENIEMNDDNDLEDSNEIENYQVNNNVRFEQENIDISEDVMECDINDDDIDVLDSGGHQGFFY